MKKFEDVLRETEENLDLSRLSIAQSRVYFARGLNTLCSRLSPELNILELDMRHNGDAIYLSFYDIILRQKKEENSCFIT
jgi:hypothetical protein